MIQWFFVFILVLILIFIIFYNILKWTEDKVLYYPSKKCIWKPQCNYAQVYMNVHNYEDICYSSRKKKKKNEYISGWHFDNFPGNKTVLFCHGNTGNISHREYIVDLCYKMKLNLFVFDYRGFGKSDGFAYKTFFKEDACAAYDYLRHHCDISHKKIIVWGESIGGLSASWIASKYKCAALILMCTFSGLDDILNFQFDGHGEKAVKVLTGLASYKNDMLHIKEYIKNVKCPIVIIHSKDDELIPYKCSWVNYHNINHDNKLHIKIKGKHASPHIRKSQFKRILEFCGVRVTCNNKIIKNILENLKTFAERHNNFME